MDPYRQRAPIDQGPLQIRSPYRQKTSTCMQGRKEHLQTRGFYRAPASKGPLQYIQVCREPLKTHADTGLLQKMASTDKATLQIRGPYIQGALQTKGLYSKGPL